MDDHWLVLHKRYKQVRRAITAGILGLEQEFSLDPKNVNSPKGTFKQLCEVLGIEVKYDRVKRWLVKHGRAVADQPVPVQYRMTDRQRTANRERQRRHRARLKANSM